jgi:hypothetical protein
MHNSSRHEPACGNSCGTPSSSAVAYNGVSPTHLADSQGVVHVLLGCAVTSQELLELLWTRLHTPTPQSSGTLPSSSRCRCGSLQMHQMVWVTASRCVVFAWPCSVTACQHTLLTACQHTWKILHSRRPEQHFCWIYAVGSLLMWEVRS